MVAMGLGVILLRPITSNTQRVAFVAVVITTLAGCMSLIPPYEAPAQPVPHVYPVEDKKMGATYLRVQGLPWRDYFTDPTLQRLIESALTNNRNLRKAALQVDEARAVFSIQRADRFPSINLGGQGIRAGVPADLSFSKQPGIFNAYIADVGINSWELDLWGRVRSLESSALEKWLATGAAQQAVRVALIAQVADGYLGLRKLDEQLDIAQQAVSSRETSYKIMRRRYEVGSSSKLELTEAQTLLNQAQALEARLAQNRATQLHALTELVGSDIGVLRPMPQNEASELAPVQPGLPSELLTNRPDILAAERRLRAANADIGAARAAFFPQITLTGNLGTASIELSRLFAPGSLAWVFMPSISLPIFDGGRRSANLDLAQVRRNIAVANYEQTIQTAFREVSDALAAQHWLSEQLEIQRAALAAQKERARLAQLRYDNGSAAYLEVLDAQRDLLETEQQLVQVRYALLSSRVALYAALGGDAALSAEPTPQPSNQQ